jgi:hypothetical protein
MYEARGADPAHCTSNAQCGDRLSCNGVERCSPGAPGADYRGCIAGMPVACSAGQSCVEPGSRNSPAGGCVPACANPDRDGDGFNSISCGGDDCDDNDRRIHPAAAETWQPENVDEDCRPETMGAPGGGATQVCDGSEHVILTQRISRSGSRATMERAACPGGTVCLPQPSGEAVCVPRFTGYASPPPFNGSLSQQLHPADTPRRIDAAPLRPSPLPNRQ